ncbi:hypothetical protein ACGF0J_37875 [Nonomuraea sp. NPDC047897]|uniref:T3SS (YopN, CesT) and YbjN peptide-binding chaperone 1 n=1 Tax=Nonomuraea sp. NPDC047897 TaxID=3364346 RepID=UPI00371330EA
MTAIMRVRSHVERCLQEAWGRRCVGFDSEGDCAFYRGTVVGYVRVAESTPDTIQVFAVAVRDVAPKEDLLREVNDLNLEVGTMRYVLAAKQLIVLQHLPAHCATPRTLSRACREVTDAAHRMGPVIATVHGGTTPSPPRGLDIKDI